MKFTSLNLKTALAILTIASASLVSCGGGGATSGSDSTAAGGGSDDALIGAGELF